VEDALKDVQEKAQRAIREDSSVQRLEEGEEPGMAAKPEWLGWERWSLAQVNWVRD
jgi:hypothetical protein